ncbi:MAG: hypothetical protein E6R03_07870 [Hyphomicrobiaceae bacterium]|nr:MAG: hypothetical protein E6R03_07870 [Hyphomicrobiaceae bacterium]
MMFWRKKPPPPSEIELAALEMRESCIPTYPVGLCGIGMSYGGFEIRFDGYSVVANVGGCQIFLSDKEMETIKEVLLSSKSAEIEKKQSLARRKVGLLPLELQKAREQKLIAELAECRARIKASEGA